MIKNFFGARFFVAAILTLALTFFATSSVAQARAAGVNYYFTNHRINGQYLNVNGYFYNDTNQTKYIASITIRGNNLAFQQKFPVNMNIAPYEKIFRSYSVIIPKTNLRNIYYGAVVTSR